MAYYQLPAIGASVILGVLALFQILLAAGAPLGRAAWGGAYRKLPLKLRLASVVAVPILFSAGWVALAGGDMVKPGAAPTVVRIALWGFTAYFTFNTAMNAVSKSTPEKWIMTPVSTLLTICFAVVALH